MGVFVCSVGRAVAAGVIDAKTGSMRRGTTGRVSWRLGGAGAESERSGAGVEPEYGVRSTEYGGKRGKKKRKKEKKREKKKGKKKGKKQVGGCRGRSTRRTESEEVRVTRGVAESAATPSGDDRRRPIDAGDVSGGRSTGRRGLAARTIDAAHVTVGT